MGSGRAGNPLDSGAEVSGSVAMSGPAGVGSFPSRGSHRSPLGRSFFEDKRHHKKILDGGCTDARGLVAQAPRVGVAQAPGGSSPISSQTVRQNRSPRGSEYLWG